MVPNLVVGLAMAYGVYFSLSIARAVLTSLIFPQEDWSSFWLGCGSLRPVSFIFHIPRSMKEEEPMYFLFLVFSR